VLIAHSSQQVVDVRFGAELFLEPHRPPRTLIAAELEQSRISMSSGGSGQFLCSEGSESCWQQNRRVEVVTVQRTAAR
jgi:hypothetical protein